MNLTNYITAMMSKDVTAESLKTMTEQQIEAGAKKYEIPLESAKHYHGVELARRIEGGI